MSDITIPLDEITIDNLDIDRVYGIAKKELSDTANEKWNPFDNSRVTSMLADWYLDMYFNEAGTFVDGILDGISCKLHEDDDIERVLGLAVAHAVRSHAVADIDLVMDDFASRALTFDVDDILGDGPTD